MLRRLKDLFGASPSGEAPTSTPLPKAADLIRDGRIDAEALAAAIAGRMPADRSGLAGTEAAAQAILAGASGQRAAVPALVTLLAEEGFPGQAAAWALAELGAEAEVRGLLAEGRVDARTNAYGALAGLAARGAAAPDLEAFLRERLTLELEKARSGTGLADQVLRTLAVVGAKDFPALVQQVMDGDRWCDRFELDRLGKSVGAEGFDRFARADLLAGWSTLFADHLAPPPATATEPAAADPEPDAAPPAAADEAALAEEPAGKPVDWKAFAASPEFLALPQQAQGLIAQLGPVLESLAAQAIQAPLGDLQGKEMAALLMQVLPQALPPQHVQAALHPHALNGYQAVARFLIRTGAATHGEDLVQGIKQVRKALQAQMRRSGMLGGPDYTDPDDVPAPAPKA